MTKMKEILQMKKLFKNNIKMTYSKMIYDETEDSGFLVVDAKV